MMRAIISAISVAMMVFAIPVDAQETGTLITRKAAQYKGRGKGDVRQVMLDFGACVTDRSRGRVAKMIALPVDSPEYRDMGNSIFDRSDDSCLSGGGYDGDGIGQLSFSSGLLRGALFNAVYVRDFGRSGPTDFSAIADSGYVARYAVPFSSSAQSAIALEKYGECITRADPPNARALILSYAGSPDESSAFAALSSKFGACLSTGNKIAFSKATLRGVIAEGLYWLSAAKMPPRGKAK